VPVHVAYKKSPVVISSVVLPSEKGGPEVGLGENHIVETKDADF
jgi:hypothetical protein